ncbi:nuclear transport factor 2 family protein [Levilactobacillus acidifarinae]|uniref:Bile acid 7-alpha-dehydratase n=1 Tax=Levilactobacillus acidifarinae DSM 19394 = JCM 15949 TaxID=1423715 RepID=A0A0R1LJC6_9LACO|nr:nuclear transport factor 2 family protein [Levilactobacillus acidifarinae]KRK96006.1 bile acid 7-alpha-dehydratase [Levilactobacillus acidifarinae DSM 19394]GEO69310.1 bile-acid 7-alpha-dehydratase [Levilactobacillus acidifarinae]
MTMSTQEISDRLELKQLVDQFSNYADTKENDKQVKLFAPDGQVNIINNGEVTFSLKGRDAIEQAFSQSMDDYQSVFHMSGQHTVDFLDATHATGVAYNYVVLVKLVDGKPQTTQEGVRYEDRYEKIAGHWLITERNSHFNWHLDL